jgi:hypothetical protein
MYTVPIDGPEATYDITFSVYPSTLTKEELEYAVVTERRYLNNHMESCGATAIRNRLQILGVDELPSISTIGRILAAQYLTHGRTGYYPGDYL